MKLLINIRGASASGKTTAVKQFLIRKGFSVELLNTPFSVLPISLIGNGEIIVLGDYSLEAKCLGVDRYKNGKRDIIDGIIGAYDKYNPQVIIYEHMLSSGSFKGTREIAEVASAYGYRYYGLQFSLTEEKRLKNLKARSGEKAGLKSFNTAKKRVERATEMLNEVGIKVEIVDVEKTKKEDMWKVIDGAIREENG